MLHPTVIAQEKLSVRAPANLSQTEMNEFVRLDNQGADFTPKSGLCKGSHGFGTSMQIMPQLGLTLNPSWLSHTYASETTKKPIGTL